MGSSYHRNHAAWHFSQAGQKQNWFLQEIISQLGFQTWGYLQPPGLELQWSNGVDLVEATELAGKRGTQAKDPEGEKQ